MLDELKKHNSESYVLTGLFSLLTPNYEHRITPRAT